MYRDSVYVTPKRLVLQVRDCVALSNLSVK